MPRILEGLIIKAVGISIAVYVASYAGIAIIDLYNRATSALAGVQ